MIKEPETLWEKERMDLARKEEVEAIQALIGREKIPQKLRGYILKTHGRDPRMFLYLGGYSEIKNRSWVRKFDFNHRYHAYIMPDKNIQIHTDRILNWKLHVASEFMVRREMKRLRAIFNTPAVQSEEKVSRNKYKKLTLPQQSMKKAFESLEAEKTKAKKTSFLKKFLCQITRFM